MTTSLSFLTCFSETANGREKQDFLGFAAFVSGLGPHPFLPELLGAVSVQPPLMMVVEELQHRDLLGYLWKCRQQVHTSINYHTIKLETGDEHFDNLKGQEDKGRFLLNGKWNKYPLPTPPKNSYMILTGTVCYPNSKNTIIQAHYAY